jgi:hypothetical protein
MRKEEYYLPSMEYPINLVVLATSMSSDSVGETQ